MKAAEAPKRGRLRGRFGRILHSRSCARRGAVYRDRDGPQSAPNADRRNSWTGIALLDRGRDAEVRDMLAPG